MKRSHNLRWLLILKDERNVCPLSSIPQCSRYQFKHKLIIRTAREYGESVVKKQKILLLFSIFHYYLI